MPRPPRPDSQTFEFRCGWYPLQQLSTQAIEISQSNIGTWLASKYPIRRKQLLKYVEGGLRTWGWELREPGVALEHWHDKLGEVWIYLPEAFPPPPPRPETATPTECYLK